MDSNSHAHSPALVVEPHGDFIDITLTGSAGRSWEEWCITWWKALSQIGSQLGLHETPMESTPEGSTSVEPAQFAEQDGDVVIRVRGERWWGLWQWSRAFGQWWWQARTAIASGRVWSPGT